MARLPMVLSLSVFATVVWVDTYSVAQTTERRAEPTWVLLRNGQVMQGCIQREDARYKINLAEGGFAVLPRREIWRVERSLRDLYTFRRQDAELRGAEAHFELAKWCLTQKLHAEASAHLAIADRAQLDEEKLRDLRARIEVAISNRGRRPAISAQPVSAPLTGSPKSPADTDSSSGQFTPAALQQFTTRIQPLLINRCGNATCHGRVTQTEFQLTRPTRRGLFTPRITQLNARAAERLVNYAAPGDSDLLEWSAKAHGGTPAAALNEGQLKTLRQWLATLTGKRSTASASPKPSRSAKARRTGGLIDPLADHAATPDGTPAGLEASSRKGRSTEDREDCTATDPFDPEAFNRQHHPPQG